MLNVHRRPDADTGVEEFLHVLPPLGVSRRGLATYQIRVRQFVDQEDGGMTRQSAVEIEFLANDAAIAHGERGEPL